MKDVARLLIQEPPLQVLPSLAKAIGLNEAIVLQQLWYLLRDPKHGKRIAEKQWIFNTYEQWQADFFPFWNERTIRRVFTNLSRRGLIEHCQPEGRMSRRKYYRINEAKLVAIADTAKLAGSMRPKVALPVTKTSSHTSKDDTPILRGKTGNYGFEEPDFSEEEARIVDFYHRVCVASDTGFRPITKRSDELAKAFERFQDKDDKGLTKMFRDAVEYRKGGSRDRTLVRILWTNL